MEGLPPPLKEGFVICGIVYLYSLCFFKIQLALPSTSFWISALSLFKGALMVTVSASLAMLGDNDVILHGT
jgi:hypothetical protein